MASFDLRLSAFNFLRCLLKPGIATIALRKYDIFTALDLAAEAGFMGVEIWGKPPHIPAEFDEEHVRKVRDRARSCGLEIPVFGSYVNPAWPGYEQAAEDSLRIAKLLGARIIRVWAGNKEPHEADEELWKQVTTSFHEFALKAEYQGIRLAMEMHAATLCATAEGSLRVIEEANAPNLRLNYQVYNPAEPDLERVIGMVGDLVVNMHAQNHRQSCLNEGKMEQAWIENGLVDYDHALALLAEHGFKGYVEAEFLRGENVCEGAMMESLRKDAEYLRRVTARYS